MKYFTLLGSGLVLAGVLSAAAVGDADFDFQWIPPSTSPPGALAPNSSGAGGATLEDPRGDIFGLGICPPPPDLKSLQCRVSRRGTRLNCTVNFFAPENDDIRANGPVGFIDFDTDQNPATGGLLNTGGLSNTDIFGPPGTNTGLGMDYNIFFFSPRFGVASVFKANGDLVGTVPERIVGQRLSVSIPLRLLGDDDGIVDFAGVFGSVCEPTDIVPNAGHGTSE